MNWLDTLTLVTSIIAIIVAICSARYTRKQYLSGIRPILSNNALSFNPQNKKFSFDIMNSGSYAQITKIKTTAKGFTITSNMPIIIQRDETIDICGEFTNNHIVEGICIKIKYKDIDGNKYCCKMKIGER